MNQEHEIRKLRSAINRLHFAVSCLLVGQLFTFLILWPMVWGK